MGIQHTCCKKDCSQNNQKSDLEVKINVNQINYKSKMTTSTENITLKTTFKGHDYLDSSTDNIDEQQSSNLETNPIPEFIKSKTMHSSIIPPRTNRFMMDMEVEVRAKIKEIQLQEQIEANKVKSKSPASSLNLLGNAEGSVLNSSQLQFEGHPSTQLECITAPVQDQKKQKGILKSLSSQRNVSSKDSKKSNRRVHFSNETKFKTKDIQKFYRWRNFSHN